MDQDLLPVSTLPDLHLNSHLRLKPQPLRKFRPPQRQVHPEHPLLSRQLHQLVHWLRVHDDMSLSLSALLGSLECNTAILSISFLQRQHISRRNVQGSDDTQIKGLRRRAALSYGRLLAARGACYVVSLSYTSCT